MKGDVNFNNVTGGSSGTALAGMNPVAMNTVALITNVVPVTSSEISTTSDPTISDSSVGITTKSATSNSQNTVIIATVTLSCFIVFILVYFILIRPRLRRKAEKYSDTPIDTTRAPMDLEFRQPKKKKWFQDRFQFFRDEYIYAR